MTALVTEKSEPNTRPVEASAAEVASPRSGAGATTIADIKRQLHAFSAEVSRELSEIESLLLNSSDEGSVTPSAKVEHALNAKPSASTESPSAECEASGRESDKASKSVAVTRTTSEAAEHGQDCVSNSLSSPKPGDLTPQTNAGDPHGVDRLTALKKRLAEKLQAEVDSSISQNSSQAALPRTTEEVGQS